MPDGNGNAPSDAFQQLLLSQIQGQQYSQPDQEQQNQPQSVWTQLQPQQPQTSTQAAVAPQRDLTKEPIFEIKAGHYGFKGDETMDANSASGKSVFKTPLTNGTSIRLSPDMEDKLGAQPNDHFTFTGKDGTQRDLVFNDRAPNTHGMLQVYDSTGQLGELGEGTISRPGATGAVVPTFRMDNEKAARMPGAWGIRVADPDDVARYDQFVKNGGDATKIPVMDQAGIAVAKDPDFFFRPQNRETAWQLIGKPLSEQNTADEFNRAVMNAPGQLWNLGGDVLQATNNTVRGWMDAAQLGFLKATGQGQGEDYNQVRDRLAKEQATGAQGVGQIEQDLTALITGAYNNFNRGMKPLALAYVGNDAQSREEVERNYFYGMLDMMKNQQGAAKVGNALQDKIADGYMTVGLKDVADKIRTADPNWAAVTGISAVAQSIIPEAEGFKAAGAVKPVKLDLALKALEDSTIADAKKTALNATQIQPTNPERSAANPNYGETRAVQADLAPVARTATDQANQQANNVANVLTNVNRISTDPGTVTNMAAGLLTNIGKGLDKTGAAVKYLRDYPEMIAQRYADGNPVAKGILQDVVGKFVFGWALHHLGPIGAVAEVGLEKFPEIADSLSGLFKAYGKELPIGEATIPLHTRVAMQTKLMPKGLASALDSTLMQNTVAVARGGIAGAATQAAIGGVSGGITGAVGGAFMGGINGMVGGGLGQWQRYQDPNQYLLQARGDWKSYRDGLSTVNSVPNDVPGPSHQDIAQRAFEISQAKGGGDATQNWLQAENELKANPPQKPFQLGSERDNFDKLSPTNQLVLAQYGQHYPGLRVNYVNDPTAASGFHFLDNAGRSNIQINLANPSSTIRAVIAHELVHGAIGQGFLPQIYDSLFGNPQTGRIGQFTAVDAMGKPLDINPATGRYVASQEFYNLANEYKNKMTQNGLPTSHLNDFAIAREIYAENGVDYLLSGTPLLDAASAFRPGLVSESAYKTALAKMGYAFDESGKMIGAPGGTIGGAGLFTDLQRNRELQNLAGSFFATTEREGRLNVDDKVTHRFLQSDLQNPNTANTWLTNTSEIMRRPDGTAIMDPLTGQPMMRTPKEVAEYNAKLSGALRSGLEALPENQRNELGMRQTTDEKGRTNTFVRYLPDNMLDALGRTNEYNPHQIASLRMLSRVLADKGNPGMEVRMFYNKALTAGKKYRGFEGSERFATPYGIEITHDNQVNIKGVDFQQLNKNFQKLSKRDPYKTLWNGNPDAFTQDAHTYFTNHANGRPGADTIGEQKRDAINSLAGFGTVMHRETNPLVGLLPKGMEPIINSYRIDRSNQISATGAMRPFISEAQYYAMNRNYLPGAAEVSYAPRQVAPASAGVPPDQSAIPVTMRTTRTGKEVPQEIPYDITKAPLVADKQPPETLSGKNDFGHVDFLTKPDQQRLTHLNDASAVTDYADKLVAEHDRFKDNKPVMAAKNWYDDVLGHLKKGFGGDKELFAQLLAATSAQNGVRSNFADALEAYKQYRAGAYDDAIREFKRTGKITEDMKPRKADGVTKFGVNSDAVLKVLADKWMDNVQGPKTPNFFRNLFKRGTDATIDMWAARTMRRLGNEGVEGADPQWRIQPASETGVSNLDFAFSQQAFKQAADRLGMKPHQLQAILWYGEKSHWAQQGWSKGGVSAAMESYIPQLKAYAAAPEVAPPKTDTRRMAAAAP